MVVCHNKKCIYIHIPKTAGTSVEQFLRENGKNGLQYHGVRNGRSMHHFTAFDLKYEIPLTFQNYYKFTFVRNPYDRLLSEYYWTPIPGVGYKSGQTKADFITYVSRVVNKRLFFDNIFNDHFIPQYLFIYNGKKFIIDDIFKYEDLNKTVDILKEKLNINTNFPCLNKSINSTIIKTGWNENQKERIYKIYKNDFILFNYPK
jgi:hypothetical protein